MEAPPQRRPSHSGSGGGGVIKRIRQACSNCRRRKVKCSGDRPICAHCQQNRRSCVYEPYSNAPVPNNDATTAPSMVLNNVLLERISSIENALSKLSQGDFQLHGQLPSPSTFATEPTKFGESSDPYEQAALVDEQSLEAVRPDISLDQLPPLPILRSLIDTYFSRAHNQPYSFFHPASFRQSVEDGSVPRCLMFAVLAFAVRFSNNPVFVGRTYEASDAYSRRSWLYVIEDHLATDDNSDLAFIQTVALLAIIDYTAGKVSPGWLRLGLAIRLSQDLHLTSEPPPFLPNAKREEQRRTFWSIYLLDKLMSCARSKPAALLDQDCTVQLPCDEATFRNMEHKQTPTLQQMMSWDSGIEEPPSLFSLTIATSSIFARCTRYARGQTTADSLPPWHPQSEFTSTNASLLFVESYLRRGSSSILNLITDGDPGDDTFDIAQIGHLILAHAVFHLCHCLLNHPFLMRLRLRPVAAKAPGRFASDAFQLCQEHARKLTDILEAAAESKLFIKSSFYSYCAAISAGVHCLASSAQQQGIGANQYDARRYFEKSMGALEKLAVMWPMVLEMMKKLNEFDTLAGTYASLFDVKCLGDNLDPLTENTLWTLIDYGLLARETPEKSPGPTSYLSNLPSPSTWTYPMDDFAPPADLCNTENHMLFMDVEGSRSGY